MKELKFGDKNIRLRWGGVKEYFWEYLEERTKAVVRRLLEEGLRVEMDYQLGVGKYRRDPGRRDWRNGYYARDLITSLGVISSFLVPRSRKGVYRSQILERYRRRTSSFDHAVKEMFVLGLSTRRTEEFLKVFFGEGILSPQGVSRVFRKVEEELKGFREREISDDYVYLFSDGFGVTIRQAFKRPYTVLFALGVTGDGKKEVIDFKVVSSEKTIYCQSFLQSLYNRGLEGKNLELVICDGSPGLVEAISWIYPKVKRQNCSVHKLRNISKYIKNKKAHRRDLYRDASAVYKAKGYMDAIDRIETFIHQWQSKEPKAVKNFITSIDDTLRFFEFEKNLWSFLKSTNPLESYLKEIRRRVRLVDSFRDERSCETLIFALVKRYNNQGRTVPLFKKTKSTQFT